MLKKTAFFILAGILSAASLYASDYKNILAKADSLVSYPGMDFSAEYRILHDKPGESQDETVSAVFRRDSEKIYTIIVLEPEINKGEGYLKLEDTLWFYDPESRKFNYTSSKEKFQNSNARNSDFTSSTLAEDYDIVKGNKVKLGKYNCTLLELEANNDKVTYPFMKIWISEDNLVRKTEDYSLSGQLLRTTAVPRYNLIGKKYVPVKIMIFDSLSGATVNGRFIHEKTIISISKASFKKIPDSVFSKNFLEKTGR